MKEHPTFFPNHHDRWRAFASERFGLEQIYFDIWIGRDKAMLKTEEVEFDEGNEHRRPTMSIPRPIAQCLFDSMWRAGLRPSEGIFTDGERAAMQRHLDDLRGCLVSAGRLDA